MTCPVFVGDCTKSNTLKSICALKHHWSINTHSWGMTEVCPVQVSIFPMDQHFLEIINHSGFLVRHLETKLDEASHFQGHSITLSKWAIRIEINRLSFTCTSYSTAYTSLTRQVWQKTKMHLAVGVSQISSSSIYSKVNLYWKYYLPDSLWLVMNLVKH